MGKVRRLSNRELRAAIKRNDLEEAMQKGGEWLKANVENVLIGAVLAVVLAVLVPYWLSSQSEQQAQSAVQLRAAQSDFQRALSAGPGQADALRQARSKYQAVVTSYAGTDAAAHASLGASQADLKLGEADQAIANFQGFLSEFGEDHALAPLAVAGMAQAYEAKSEWAKAAAQYQSLDDGRQPPAPNLGVSLLDAARCLRKAGKMDLARQVVARAQKDRKALGLSEGLLALATQGLK
jgi:predicted negative regulator of RcsB-dependent stress response